MAWCGREAPVAAWDPTEDRRGPASRKDIPTGSGSLGGPCAEEETFAAEQAVEAKRLAARAAEIAAQADMSDDDNNPMGDAQSPKVTRQVAVAVATSPTATGGRTRTRVEQL